MRRHVKTGWLLFCMLFLASLPVTAQETPKPKVSLKEHTHDFREVMEGEVIKHTFSIFNQGNGELRILKVSAG